MLEQQLNDFISLFDHYALKQNFSYFVGGQYEKDLVINFCDSADSRSKLVLILLELRHDLPDLMGSSHDRKKISIEDFVRRFQDKKSIFSFFKKKDEYRSPKSSYLYARVSGSASRFIHGIDSSDAGLITISLKPWKFFNYYDDVSFYEPLSSNTKSSVVRRLRPQSFERLCSLSKDSSNVFPSAISAISFPIDAVYTWVDGEDIHWQESKSRYLPAAKRKRVAQSNRFKSRNELLYSIRSLELNAPWINHIYIVTDRQLPDWLDEKAAEGRVTLVDHTTIMDEKYRPCFNSSAIETFLHRIEGLNEHFLYLNDDFLFGKKVSPEDFFLSNGVLKCFPSDQRALPFDIDASSEEYIQADKEALSLIYSSFKQSGNYIMKHAPYPSSRSLLFELESRYCDAFDKCRSNRFRSSGDIRPIAFMQYHYGYNLQRVVYDDISCAYVRLSRIDLESRLERLISKRKFSTICLNDAGKDTDEASTDRIVSDFLERMYPVRLTYERADT